MSEQLSRATGPAYVTSISLIDFGQSVSMDGSSFRDTEGYIEVRAIFVQFLKGLPLNALRMYTGSFTLSAM